MMHPQTPTPSSKWNERPTAPALVFGQSEVMFRTLFERSADAIWLFDPGAGVFVDCNGAAVELMRAGTKANLLQTRPEDLSPPRQPDGTASGEKAAQVAALTEQQGGYRFEWVARRLDGEEVPLEVLSTPIQVEGRSIHVVVSRDITKRKRDEARIRESEHKFRCLFESSSEAILLLDPSEQRILDCNESAVRMSRGGTKEWILSQPLLSLSAQFQLNGRRSEECLPEYIERAFRNGGYYFEWQGRTFGGAVFPVEATLTPIHLGTRTLMMAVLRDITERKLTEAALVDSQRLLASICDNIFEAIYRSGPEHDLIFVNQAYLKMFGYQSLAELQGLPRDQLYATPATRAHLLAMLAMNDCFSHEEVEYRRQDGSLFWGLSSARIIREPQTGRVSYQVGAIIDITERKRDEAEIRRLNQSLEHRIADRTAELSASEARLRALVEHAPEAIVVFDGSTGGFLFGNEHACRLYGISADRLTSITPADVSPEYQPCGRRSSELAREKMEEALAGGTPVFEWMHRQPGGRLVPTEVRLLRLPAKGQNLIRASIIDNSERKRREKIQQAVTHIAEAVHTAEDLNSFYRTIHSVISGLMPAENFYIALLDAQTQMISFAYHVDHHTPHPPPQPLNTGLTSVVLRTGEALLVGRRMEERKRQVGTEVTFEGLVEATYVESGVPTAIWLGVPLLVQSKPIGVVAVQDYDNEQAYGEEEKRILTFVAGQIALAIERKRVAQALQESEAKFRALFESSSQGVMLHDDQSYLEVNPAAVRILGYQCQEQLIGKHPRDTSPEFQPNGETSASLTVRYIQECMSKGSSRFEWTGRTAQGKDISLEVTLTRIEWSGRQILQAFVTDISERKKAEAELRASEARLRESEARFSTAFRASPIAITISRVDDGKYVLVNEAFLIWSGYTRDEVLGRTSAELGLWVDPAEREPFWEEVRRVGWIRERECRLKNRSGTACIRLLSCDLIEIEGVPHLLTIAIDITQRKQAEAELLKTLAREKELGQLKSNFVSMVSHEFRTPLGIIQSSAEILHDYFQLLGNEEREQQLDSIVQNTRRMAQMMEETLVLSRLEAGRMDFKPEHTDFEAFCRRIANEVRAATGSRCPIEVKFNSFPPQVMADDRLLSHVFTNLLMNAVKYSPPGATVHFDISRDGPEVVCVVRDRGIGIPELDLPWLFDAFHRGRNVGDRPGTGLGLVLVKRCVELHRGKVQIESKTEQGTTVTVRLPVYETAT